MTSEKAEFQYLPDLCTGWVACSLRARLGLP